MHQLVDEEGGGEQIGCAAGGCIKGEQRAVELIKRGTTRDARAAAEFEHSPCTLLAGLQSGQAGAMQQAGVVERSHDREQCVKPRGFFIHAVRTRCQQRGKADRHDVRKAILRFAPRAAHLVALTCTLAVAIGN
jgi:hypothetical protein